LLLVAEPCNGANLADVPVPHGPEHGNEGVARAHRGPARGAPRGDGSVAATGAHRQHKSDHRHPSKNHHAIALASWSPRQTSPAHSPAYTRARADYTGGSTMCPKDSP